MKRSNSAFRFIIAFWFGLVAETFARLAVVISGDQLNVNFSHLAKRDFIDQKTVDNQSDF